VPRRWSSPNIDLSTKLDQAQLVRALPDPEGQRTVERARQEADDGRRGTGNVFGASQPSPGEALTVPYQGRITADFADCREWVEAWIPAEIQRVYAILDNVSIHRAPDVLRFRLAHPH
jgi:hypothetical protein